ncbi:hypothetical protein BKA93DRAFT_343253 [Sparassis latifolia]
MLAAVQVRILGALSPSCRAFGPPIPLLVRILPSVEFHGEEHALLWVRIHLKHRQLPGDRVEQVCAFAKVGSAVRIKLCVMLAEVSGRRHRAQPARSLLYLGFRVCLVLYTGRDESFSFPRMKCLRPRGIADARSLNRPRRLFVPSVHVDVCGRTGCRGLIE